MDLASFLTNHKPEELKDYILYEHENKVYVEEKGVISTVKRFLLDGHYNYSYNLKSIYENHFSEFTENINRKWKSKIENLVIDYAKKKGLEAPLTLRESLIKTNRVFTRTKKQVESSDELMEEKWKRVGFTPTTYAFTNGDSFIGSTGLEGGNVEDNIELILRFYENCSFEGKDTVVSLLKNVTSPNAPDLSERIKNLKPGEKILIHGGWTTHAILYLVEKTDDGKFAFSTINTGAGINDFHQSKDFGTKVKYKPLVRIHQIEESVITNPKLWESFSELKIQTKANGTLWEHSADDIYRRILPALQGKRDLDFENGVDFITDQRTGTCSWKAIMKLIFITTAETKEYKKENFYFRYLSNLEFSDDVFRSENPSSEEIELLKRGSENFVRHALKMEKESIIDKDDLQKALNFKEKINSKIQALEERQKKVRAVLINPDERLPLQTSLQSSFFQTHTPRASVVTERDRFPEGLPVNKLVPFPQTFEDFKQRLDDLNQVSSELGKASQVRGSIQVITDFVALAGELLKPGAIEKICEGQSDAEIEKIIECVYELHEKVLLHISALPVNERMTPDHLALMAILGVLNAKFMRQLSQEQFPMKQGFQPIPKLFFELLETEPFAIIQNKELALRFFQAKEVFSKSKSAGIFDSWTKISSTFYKVSIKDDKLQDNKQMLKLLEHLQENDANLSGLTQRELFNKVMTTFGTDSCPLPKWFQILFKQHMLCQYIQYDPNLSKVEFQDTQIKFTHSQGTEDSDSYSINFFGQKGVFDEKSKDALKKTFSKQCSSRQKGFRHEGLKKLLFKTWRGVPSSYAELDKSHNSDTTDAVKREAEEGLTRQETQTLAYYCSSNLTIIPNLIAYFSEHLDKLEDSNYQYFFYYSLFSGEHLISEIKNSSKAVDKLSGFLMQQYETNKMLGKVHQQLYFLRIMNELNQLTKNPNTTIDVKKELEALADLQESKSNKALVYQQWIAAHRDQELTDDETIKLAKAYVYVSLYGSEDQVEHSIIDGMYRTMDQVFANVSKLQEISQKRIVDESLQETLSEKTGGEYTLDVNSLTIYKGANPVRGVPYQLFQDPNFIELFGKTAISAISPVPGVYEFTTGTGLYQVFFSESTQKIQIQKNIDGKWYNYIENNQLTNFFSSVALNVGYFHWMGDTENSSMILERKEDHRVHSKISFELLNPAEQVGKYKITSWQKYDHQKGEYGVGLNQLSKKQALFLDRFQPKETILLWDDSIEFSALGLEFNKKGDKYLYSKDPKYHLALKQIPPAGLEHFSGYLRMVNDKGKVQYLIPKASLEANVAGSLQRAISINTKTTDYMVFKEKEGKLVAKTEQEHLFLAYLHLAHKNYAEADKHLQPNIAGKPQGYGIAENQVMDWIFDYLEIAKDRSPEGVAIGLQAISLYIRSLSTEERVNAKSGIREMAGDLLMKYYPLAQHAKKYQLEPAQEKELLEFCGSTSEALKQRNQQISSFSAEIEQPNSIDSESIKSELNTIERERLDNLYLNGGKKLQLCFDDMFAAIISDDAEIRHKAASELLMMKIPPGSHLDGLRSMLFLIAKHGNDEIRLELSQKRDDKIEALIEAYAKIKKIIPERVEPALTNFEQVHPIDLKPLDNPEKKSVTAKAGFKLNDAYLPPAYSIMEVIDNNMKLELEKSDKKQIDNSGLIDAFLIPGKTASRVAKKEFDFVVKGIESYTNKVNSSEKFAITDSQLDSIVEISEARKEYLLEKAEEQKIEIEKLLNKEPSDFRENLIYRLQVHGQVKKVLTVDDLMIFYLQNNSEELLKQNPHLTENDLTKLAELLTDYLVNMTECDYLENLKKSSDTARKEVGRAKEKALNDINMLLKSKRSYDAKVDRIILIYEYSSGFRLRSDQVDLIRSMTISDASEINNTISQLIMGSGKSKVILPLLSYLNSRGDNIPIIITPDALFGIHLEDSRIFSGQYLRQEREVIILKEGEQIGEKDIDEIIKKLERVKERRSYLLVNPTVIHSLRLYADSVYCELSETTEPSAALESKYSKIKKVMTMLKNEGDVIIDEADLVLNCRKETNLSTGEWENINVDTQNVIEAFFTSVVQDPELSRYLKIEKETEIAFDETDYKEKVQPKLMQMFIDMALKEGMEIDDKQKQEIEDYLLSAKELTQVPFVITSASPKAQKVLAIGKEMIKTLLPLLATNHCDMDFGLSKKTKSNVAIPFAGSNNPSEGSSFGTPFESLIYTITYYTRKGVSADRMNILIEHLRTEALREAKAKNIPLENTQAFKDFQKLNLVPTKNLFTIQDSEIVDSLPVFNQNVKNRIRFAREFGWIEVKFNPERYSSNAQDLVGTFHSVKGFSGTLLHNFATFHRSLETKQDLSVIGMTLSLMYHSGAQVNPFANLEAFINSLANYNACIDIGCWFRGINAIEVAKKIFEVLPTKMQGIAYVNDVDIPPGTKDQQVILLRGAKEPILLSQSKLKPDERFTYYNVITGVDIPQDDFARAIATIGETTTLRDVEQGVWRMRGLKEKQIVDLAVPEELKIQQDLESVFLFTTENQAAIKEKDNPHALQQKIQHEIKALLEAVLSHEEISPKDAGEIARAGRQLLVKVGSQDPVRAFGGISTKEKMETIVDAQIQQALDYVKTELYDKFSIFEQIMPCQKLEERIRDLPNYEDLPEEDFWQPAKAGQSAQGDYGVKTQTKLKTNTKTQTKMQVQVKAIEDMKRIQTGKMITDVYWNGFTSGNLFSYGQWKSFRTWGQNRVFDSVNQYLEDNQNTLFNYEPTQPIFSENLHMSIFFKYFSERENSSTPFQLGTKPEGVCSLRINRKTGKMDLDFLHPDEAEKLWITLDAEKAFNGKKDKYLKKIEEIKPIFYEEAMVKIEKYIEKEYGEKGLPEGLSLEDVKDKLEKINWNNLNNFDEVLHSFPYKSLFDNLSDDIQKLWKLKMKQPVKALNLNEAETMFSGEKDFDLLLVNPSTGVVKAGKNDIDEETLKQNPEYNKLMAQAKFYHGKLDDYTPEEVKYLKQWAKEVGVTRLESFLINNIFRTRAEDRERYENSVLRQVFAEASA